MKHWHTNLMVCPSVKYKWDIEGHWTPVQHVLDIVEYGSDTAEYDWTRL